MGKKSIIELICDRCKNECVGDPEGRDEPNRWADLTTRQATDSQWRSAEEKDWVVCPSCISELKRFMRGLSTEAIALEVRP